MSAQLLSVETRRALARSPLVGPLTLALTTDPIGERARTRDAVDRAYWTFTRCAKGAPVSVRLVDEKLWAEEAYRRAIVPTMRAAWDLARELTEQRAETSGTVATAHIEG